MAKPTKAATLRRSITSLRTANMILRARLDATMRANSNYVHMLDNRLDRSYFVQIAEVRGFLYGLDGNGQVWTYQVHAKTWTKVSMERGEYVKYEKGKEVEQ